MTRAARLGVLLSLWPGSAGADDTKVAPSPALPPAILQTDHVISSDNQPFERVSSRLRTSGWLSARLELGVTLDALWLGASTERLSALGARGSGRLRLGAALADVSVELASRAWSDGHGAARGRLALEALPTGPLRLRVGAYREDEVSTFEAALGGIVQSGGFAEVELHDLYRLHGAVRLERLFYSDSNAGRAASGWLTLRVLSEPLRIDLGYAGAGRDTDESRWEPGAQRYSPYMTPLDSFRHGPVAALGARVGRLEASFSVSGAVWAEEDDPSTLGLFELRRATRYLETRGGLRLDSDAASIGVVHRYLGELYYAAHGVELDFRVVL